eukprot:TRINITY_DN102126_c0_g1_i1.p1 TRINITY_DN102126_c0_g1~~TRINITY_DN102126_c0_g1_i1.p1  ORF type:complete len:167 (+),score=20.92 TRINITY_DN102126_c0_g1_i1:126-626(+)
MALMMDIPPAPTEGPFPGESIETMDDLRQECAVLRQQKVGLEAENAELRSMLREWRQWYTNSYKPQVEFLDSEVTRIVALAPQGKRLVLPPSPAGSPPKGSLGEGSLRSTGTPKTGGMNLQSLFTAPPGLRRQASEPGQTKRSPKHIAALEGRTPKNTPGNSVTFS